MSIFAHLEITRYLSYHPFSLLGAPQFAPVVSGRCSPISSYAPLSANRSSLIVGEPLLSALQGFRLLVVDSRVAHVGAFERCTVSLSENVVGLNTTAESACSRDGLALLLALHTVLNTVEDRGSLFH